MPAVTIEIVNQSGNPLPAYATPGAAGMDLRACLSEPLLLQPMARQLVPTGLFMAIPPGFEAQVRPRSGLAIQHGITCLNTPGTIDSDYRGEVKVILINLGQEAFKLQHGDRIAQLVISRVEQAGWQPVELLSITTRGEGGFGHTGKQ